MTSKWIIGIAAVVLLAWAIVATAVAATSMAKADRAELHYALLQSGVELAKTDAYNQGHINATSACVDDLREWYQEFVPAENCSIVLVNPDYTLQTCEGEDLYAHIQSAKDRADAEWNQAAKEGRLIHPVIS